MKSHIADQDSFFHNGETPTNQPEEVAAHQREVVH